MHANRGWHLHDWNLAKILPAGHIAHTHKRLEVLNPEMQALIAEIFETLHKAEYNHNFSSTEKDEEWLTLVGHPAKWTANIRNK